MLTLVKNIKDYFTKKERNEAAGESPAGMCPTCWGRNEWDGKYFEIVKDKHLVSGGERYESFISKIVDEHVEKTRKYGDKYICTTCDKEI